MEVVCATLVALFLIGMLTVLVFNNQENEHKEIMEGKREAPRPLTHNSCPDCED